MSATVIETGAVLDPPYRYLLWRTWDESLERLLFVMLNPSRAGATTDDPTIRRCLAFAQDWGYGSLRVVNLYGYQASDPAELWRVADPVGPENDAFVQEAAKQADTILVAWGATGAPPDRVRVVLSLLQTHPRPLLCLGQTKHGCPRHPLYLPATTCRWPFWAPAWMTNEPAPTQKRRKRGVMPAFPPTDFSKGPATAAERCEPNAAPLPAAQCQHTLRLTLWSPPREEESL